MLNYSLDGLLGHVSAYCWRKYTIGDVVDHLYGYTSHMLVWGPAQNAVLAKTTRPSTNVQAISASLTQQLSSRCEPDVKEDNQCNWARQP